VVQRINNDKNAFNERNTTKTFFLKPFFYDVLDAARRRKGLTDR